MSKLYNVDGINSNVEFGEDGPRIKNDSGQMQVRNAGDSALATLKVADGSAADDAASKGQVDSLDSSQVKYVSVDFAFDTSSPFNIGSAVPANSTVIRCMVQIDTAFDGTTPQIDIGDGGQADRIMADTLINEDTPGLYVANVWVEYASLTQLTGTLTLSGATQGAGSVLIQYV